MDNFQDIDPHSIKIDTCAEFETNNDQEKIQLQIQVI